MAITDVKFGNVKFGGGMYPAVTPMAVPQIRRDKSVQCVIDVTNTGNVIIPADRMTFLLCYALNLTSIGDKTCERMSEIWFDESVVFHMLTNDTDIASDGTYTFVSIRSAENLSLGLQDAGLVLMLDIDGDGAVDTYTDCLRVVDAFEVVSAERWGASLGTPEFTEVE